MSLSDLDLNRCNELIDYLENTDKVMYDQLLTKVSESMTKYTIDQGYDDLFETMFEDNIYELLIKFWIIELKKENLWGLDTVKPKPKPLEFKPIITSSQYIPSMFKKEQSTIQWTRGSLTVSKLKKTSIGGVEESKEVDNIYKFDISDSENEKEYYIPAKSKIVNDDILIEKVSPIQADEQNNKIYKSCISKNVDKISSIDFDIKLSPILISKINPNSNPPDLNLEIDNLNDKMKGLKLSEQSMESVD